MVGMKINVRKNTHQIHFTTKTVQFKYFSGFIALKLLFHTHFYSLIHLRLSAKKAIKSSHFGYSFDQLHEVRERHVYCVLMYA